MHTPTHTLVQCMLVFFWVALTVPLLFLTNLLGSHSFALGPKHDQLHFSSFAEVMPANSALSGLPPPLHAAKQGATAGIGIEQNMHLPWLASPVAELMCNPMSHLNWHGKCGLECIVFRCSNPPWRTYLIHPQFHLLHTFNLKLGPERLISWSTVTLQIQWQYVILWHTRPRDMPPSLCHGTYNARAWDKPLLSPPCHPTGILPCTRHWPTTKQRKNIRRTFTWEEWDKEQCHAMWRKCVRTYSK